MKEAREINIFTSDKLILNNQIRYASLGQRLAAGEPETAGLAQADRRSRWRVRAHESRATDFGRQLFSRVWLWVKYFSKACDETL